MTNKPVVPRDKKRLIGHTSFCTCNNCKWVAVSNHTNRTWREYIESADIEGTLFETMQPVLCEKTNEGEWIISSPDKLATAIRELLLGDK